MYARPAWEYTIITSSLKADLLKDKLLQQLAKLRLRCR